MPNTLAELLKLPLGAGELCHGTLGTASPTVQREVELVLTPEQEAELDRRLADHLASPGSAVPWDEVRRKLAGGG